MYKIGIDVGSTFTKYCVMNDDNVIEKLFTERTPVRQLDYFRNKLAELKAEYPDSEFYSCGYGRNNISSDSNTNELITLAKGSNYVNPEAGVVLDIGGQDTKIISHYKGNLKTFFINEKCAAGSGMFLLNVCKLLETDLKNIDLSDGCKPSVTLSSVCAVFAQSEIVKLISENVHPDEIIKATIWQIFTQSKVLLNKVPESGFFLSGGLTLIPGIEKYASLVSGQECTVIPYGSYLSAIGCAIMCGSG